MRQRLQRLDPGFLAVLAIAALALWPFLSRPGLPRFTDAELRVSACVARGMTNRGIAEELYLSHHTVDAHLKHVYLKLDIHSREELAAALAARPPDPAALSSGA